MNIRARSLRPTEPVRRSTRPFASDVLVTGGCGFLGRPFIAAARAAGRDARSLDLNGHADLVCDIADASAVAIAIADARPAAVVHLAARLSDAGNDDPVAAVRTNAVGCAAVFSAAERAGVERVIYASSNAAVGPCTPDSGDATPLAPRSVYGATKAFGEHLALAMSTRPGAPAYLALRFGWIYGPGRERGWRDVQSVVERVVAGERVVRYPEYGEPIDWTWIDDAAHLLLRALDAPLPRFAAVNAVGDRRTVRDAFIHLQHRFPDLVATGTPAAMPPSGWGLVNDAVHALLGPLACTRLEDGLDRMIAMGRTGRNAACVER